MNLELIILRQEDLDMVREIYNYYFLNSTSSFFTGPISVDELKTFIPVGHPKYQSFVIHHDGKSCGFCYLSQYNKRQAYDRTAEISLYLHPDVTGRGIGKVVLEKMEGIAIEQGIRILIGYISAENVHSISLFEKFGYERCAHFKKVGEKFGRLLDVYAYEKMIGE